MPRYLRKMDELSEKGITRISSFSLGQELGLTPSQVRQDFSSFGEFGQQGYGYRVSDLRDQLAGILGIDKGYRAILVGVGHIGHALMDNFCFSEWGFNLVRAFDVNADIIGHSFGGVEVSGMDALEAFLQENEIDVAVLTVPRDAALPVSEVLIGCGIKAIWNFTNVELVQPDSPIIVENMHFSDSLLALSYYMTAQRLAQREASAEEAAPAEEAHE